MGVSDGRQTETVAAALEFAHRQLRQSASCADSGDELHSDARALVRLATGFSDADLYARPDAVIGSNAMTRLAEFVVRRRAGEPFAYIEGTRGFHEIELVVNANVLVPRPETELIVDAVLQRVPAERGFSMLDPGTGSGAIALAVAKARPDADVVGVDFAAALNVARANGLRLGLQVQWLESDWFAELTGRRFDFICCNPPYIRSDDHHLESLGFEPLHALDGGSDGLDAIRRVLGGCRAHLCNGGTMMLEHGYDQAAEVRRIAAAAGLQCVESLRDLAGHERVSIFVVRSSQ